MEISEYTYLISESTDILQAELSKKERRFIRSTKLYKMLSNRPHLKQIDVMKIFARLPAFIEDEEGDLHHEFIKGREGWAYTGQVDDANRMNGRGVLLMDDGSIFEGYFEDGVIEGYGRLIKSKLIVYIAEWSSSKIQGKAIVVNIKDKKIYKGKLENMIPSGSGTEISVSYTYKGEFKSGVKHGKGKFKWNNGNTFTGSLEFNKIQGYGEYVWAIGNSYKGYWHDSKMEGHGVYHWNDGTRYEGNYKDGLKDGYGIMINPDSTEYRGYWNKGREDGIGKEILQNGQSRVGIWKNGVFFKCLEDEVHVEKATSALSPLLLKAFVSKNCRKSFLDIIKTELSSSIPSNSPSKHITPRGSRDGFSLDSMKLVLADFSDLCEKKFKKSLRVLRSMPSFSYDSQFLAPSFLSEYIKISKTIFYKGETNSALIPDGNGSMITDDGDIYQGRWTNGHMNGYGRHISKRGNFFEGIYRKDKRQGFGIEIKTNTKFVGDWIDNQRHGQGSLETRDGLYNGSWVAGQQHGHGRVIYRDGTTYYGDFVEGKMNGYGVLTNHKRAYKGYWKDGQFVGSKQKNK